jgi:hypothetical protein
MGDLFVLIIGQPAVNLSLITCKKFQQKLTYDLIQTFALLLASIKSDKFSEVTTLWSPKALRCLSALPIDVVAANQATLVLTSRLYCN